MIDHVFPDGSRGHEYEIGDRVVSTSFYDYIPSGCKGKIVEIRPWDEKSTYHTHFYWVKITQGEWKGCMMKHLNGNLEPLPTCKPRLEVPETSP